MEPHEKKFEISSLSFDKIKSLPFGKIIVFMIILFILTTFFSKTNCLSLINIGTCVNQSTGENTCWYKQLLSMLGGGVILFAFTGPLEIAFAISAVISLMVATLIYWILPC